MWNELIQASAPGEPFMGGARRLIVVGIDAHLVEVVHHFLGAKHLVHALGTAAHQEVVNLLVECLRIGEHTVIGSIQVETEDGTTEGSDVRELVEVGEYHVERLVTTPGETSHGTVVTIGLRAEVGIDVGDEVVEQDGIE